MTGNPAIYIHDQWSNDASSKHSSKRANCCRTDWFQTKVEFNFPDGMPRRRSCCGAFTTCFIFFILLAFLGQAIYALVTRRAFEVNSMVVRDSIDPMEGIGQSEGVQIAVGLYTSGSDSQAFDVLEYMDLNVRMAGSPRPGDENRRLQHVRCSNQEVGLSQGIAKSKIWPVPHTRKSKLDGLKINWYCFDLGEYEVYGNWETEFYSMLMVGFDVRRQFCTEEGVPGECRATPEIE